MAVRSIVLLDISGIIYRAYHSRPVDKFRLDSGFPTNAIHGTCSIIMSLLDQFGSNVHIVACLDKGFKKRTSILSTYKKNRSSTPNDLIPQFPIIYDILGKMGIVSVSKDGFEADDVIATLAHRESIKGNNVIIVSSDKDMYQLLDLTHVVIYDPRTKKYIREADVSFKFGIKPKHMILYQALVGDSCDNIKGIKGIGPKTATKIICLHNGDKEAIIKEKSIDRQSLDDNIQLVTLQTDLQLDSNISNTLVFKEQIAHHDTKLHTLLKDYKLKSILTKLAKCEALSRPFGAVSAL